MSANEGPRGPGRPPKIGPGGKSTRDRLLDAALEVAVANGVERLTLAEVARLAGVTTPAIYTHFGSRSELLVAALGAELRRLDLNLASDPAEKLVAWMHQAQPSARRLLVEVYVAASRDDELAEMLQALQRSSVDVFVDQGSLDRSQFAAVSLLLLGLSHIDSIDALEVDPDRLARCVHQMVSGLTDPHSKVD